MKTFKTLAEFKRIIEVGDLLETYHFGNSFMPAKSLGIRPVSVKQTNALAFKTERGSDSWIQYPKAGNCEVKDNTLFVLNEETRVPLLSYKFVEHSND